MSHNATIALKAAMLRRSIGNHAARRMVERAGVKIGLYRLACQLLASSNFNLGEYKSCAQN